MFSLYYVVFAILVVSHFGYEDGTMVLSVPVPDHHYENMSMQYTAIFHGSKNDLF